MLPILETRIRKQVEKDPNIRLVEITFDQINWTLIAIYYTTTQFAEVD